MLVAALLGVMVLLALGLGRVGSAAVERAQADARADLTALAAVGGGADTADRVAASSGASVVRLTEAAGGGWTAVVRVGSTTASAAAAPGPPVVPR